MTPSTAPIVSKVWAFCNTLRDDGVSYGDYLEQLTYQIFLKMADEYSKPPYNRSVGIPEEYTWPSLRASARRSGVGGPLYHVAAHSGRTQGRTGPDLHQIAEEDSGPGQALSPDRQDRRVAVGCDGSRRKGRHLRRAARKERRRCEIRCRTVFHTVQLTPEEASHKPKFRNTMVTISKQRLADVEFRCFKTHGTPSSSQNGDSSNHYRHSCHPTACATA